MIGYYLDLYTTWEANAKPAKRLGPFVGPIRIDYDGEVTDMCGDQAPPQSLIYSASVENQLHPFVDDDGEGYNYALVVAEEIPVVTPI